ncbi:MAG TPA: hypothetical protein VFY89_04895 [Ktedonobacterales bacterium]
MRIINISAHLFDALSQRAAEQGLTLEQILARLLATQDWEEHAARAFDHYTPGTGAVFTSDEEFLASLRDVDAENEAPDATVRAK